jgi:transcriptional regulator with XRE-family HTH domain
LLATPPKRRGKRRGPPDPDTVGGRIRAARKAKRLSLQKVGEHCGVSAQAVGQWEFNEAEPGIGKLRLLTKLLEISMNQLTTLSAAADVIEQTTESIKSIDVTQKTTPTEGITAIEFKSDRAPNQGSHRTQTKVVQTAGNHDFALRDVIEIDERSLTTKIKDLRELPAYRVWQLPEQLFAYIGEVRIMRIRGDTMAPTLKPFDYLVIDTDNREMLGTRTIYLLSDDRTIMIRRVNPLPDSDGDEIIYRLEADNSEPRDVKAARLRVLGRVVGKLTMQV